MSLDTRRTIDRDWTEDIFGAQAWVQQMPSDLRYLKLADMQTARSNRVSVHGAKVAVSQYDNSWPMDDQWDEGELRGAYD